MTKKILTLVLGIFLTFNLSLVWAQECSGCDDPDNAANCGDIDCEFACPNCSNSAPPAPDIPVDNGIGILIAVGIGLSGLVVYRAYNNNTKQVQS
jgi:hypothetical protein